MDLTNRVFWYNTNAFVIVFIDDIFVYSKSEAEHIGHLRDVFHVLKEQQLLSKYSMFEFWFTLVAFMGHIITSAGI